MATLPAFTESQLPGFPKRSGKVRDVYDLGDRLLIVATDRISAYDWIFPNGIPRKGVLLTQMSLMWFRCLPTKNHLLTTDLDGLGFPPDVISALSGRSMIVRKAEVVPFECVVRGYLSGSAWTEYQRNQCVCGIELPPGLKESDKLPEPIFTPATKAETGHDENVTFEQMAEVVGRGVAEKLRTMSLEIYRFARGHALRRGIIIADTKFEFGSRDGDYILVDEVLTPDSSRFWDLEDYSPGGPQKSFDKQFIRDWVSETGWDKQSPPPAIPEEIVERTQQLYQLAFDYLSANPAKTN